MYGRSRKAFTLTEIMLVVALLSFILAIAIPAFFRARELSRMRACQENLHKLDGAKNQWALENNMPPEATPDWDTLVGRSRYIRASPVCTAQGTYTINPLHTEPSCSLSTQGFFPHTFDANPPGLGGT